MDVLGRLVDGESVVRGVMQGARLGVRAGCADSRGKEAGRRESSKGGTGESGTRSGYVRGAARRGGLTVAVCTREVGAEWRKSVRELSAVHSALRHAKAGSRSEGERMLDVG